LLAKVVLLVEGYVGTLQFSIVRKLSEVTHAQTLNRNLDYDYDD